jgi:hypothetical protein
MNKMGRTEAIAIANSPTPSLLIYSVKYQWNELESKEVIVRTSYTTRRLSKQFQSVGIEREQGKRTEADKTSMSE